VARLIAIAYVGIFFSLALVAGQFGPLVGGFLLAIGMALLISSWLVLVAQGRPQRPGDARGGTGELPRPSRRRDHVASSARCCRLGRDELARDVRGIVLDLALPSS
jgi:hypothetical protein